MTERAQKVMEAFYSTFANERQDFIIQKLNNDAVANAIRELINQFDDWGGDEPSGCVFGELMGIIEELENYAEYTDTEILEFLLDNFQMHSPNMNGQHSWVFKNYEMKNLVGPTAKDAIIACMEERK